MLSDIGTKPISPTTINHLLVMLKIINVKDLILEHPVTQITHISI